MLDVLKAKLNTQIEKWEAEIDSKGSTTVDAFSDMEKIFTSTIVTLCFGEDMSDVIFDIDVRDSKTTSGLVRKELTFAEAVLEIIDQITELAPTKWSNPVYQAIRKLTGIKNLTSYQVANEENCKRFRETIK